MNIVDPKTYYKNLPKKTVATAVLLFNTKKQLLVLKTHYRKYWTLPGGVVEKDESIMTALIREVKEETNLEIKNPKLAALDYCAPKIVKGIQNSESVQVLFDGGIICDEVKIDGKEIIDFEFCDTSKALKILGLPLRRMVGSYLEAKKTVYLENGIRG
jgi:8-oxo-dGTP diphosphatase